MLVKKAEGMMVVQEAEVFAKARRFARKFCLAVQFGSGKLTDLVDSEK